MPILPHHYNCTLIYGVAIFICPGEAVVIVLGKRKENKKA